MGYVHGHPSTRCTLCSNERCAQGCDNNDHGSGVCTEPSWDLVLRRRGAR